MVLVSVVDDDLSLVTPVIYAFKDSISKHIIITKDTPKHQNLATRLKNGIAKFYQKYNLEQDTKILLFNEQFDGSFINKDTMINLTNSPSNIALHITSTAIKQDGKLFTYDIVSNELVYLNKECFIAKKPLNSKMSLEDFLLLQNYTIKSKKTSLKLEKRKKHIFELFSNESLFKQIKDKLIYEKDFDKAPYQWILQTLKELEIVDEKLNLIPHKQHILDGGVFEEYIFWLCFEVGFDDIALGVMIDFDSECNQSDKKIYNEFDILMIKNNQLSTIECKYKQHLEGLELIYKYDSILDYFGDGIKAMIVNISSTPKEPFKESKSSKNFTFSALKRASIANIKVYHESRVNKKKLQKMIREYF